MKELIDLRSDTVTRPSPAMREAIAKAEVGDDVFGEDPTVTLLQETVAKMLGKEAALFTPTGVMANQLALKCHTQPGDEVIVERWSHIMNYETAAPSLLSGVQLLPIEGTRGILHSEQLPPAVRPSAYYMPHTALVCLENTHNMAGGTIYPVDEMERIRTFCAANRIALHLDGARLWNASVASGIDVSRYASLVDSVSVCFSKGLGAPVGSAIAGSKEFIAKARRYRKIFGGGMRQVGILAAAALYAVKQNIPRLKEDHEKAAYLAAELAKIKNLEIDMDTVQTNIIIADIAKTGKSVPEFLEAVKVSGVLLSGGGHTSVRAVTHMDVSMDEIRRAAAAIRTMLA